MTDMEQLQHLPLMEVLTTMLKRQMELQSKLELVKVIIGIVDRNPKAMADAPPELDEAMKAVPRMEKELLELGSIVYWLGKVRS